MHQQLGPHSVPWSWNPTYPPGHARPNHLGWGRIFAQWFVSATPLSPLITPSIRKCDSIPTSGDLAATHWREFGPAHFDQILTIITKKHTLLVIRFVYRVLACMQKLHSRAECSTATKGRQKHKNSQKFPSEKTWAWRKAHRSSSHNRPRSLLWTSARVGSSCSVSALQCKCAVKNTVPVLVQGLGTQYKRGRIRICIRGVIKKGESR